MSVIKAVISCNGLNTLNLPIFYEKINKIRKVHKFFLEFCLILTKYCVKTNPDGVIFQSFDRENCKSTNWTRHSLCFYTATTLSRI